MKKPTAYVSRSGHKLSLNCDEVVSVNVFTRVAQKLKFNSNNKNYTLSKIQKNLCYTNTNYHRLFSFFKLPY